MVVLVLIFLLPGLGFSLPVSAADTAVRHHRLADTVARELKLRDDPRAPQIPYVHWLYLDRDNFVDAIVILKRGVSSCAITAGCQGFIIQGDQDGFDVITTFAANHHPLRLGPRPTDGRLRNLYYTDDGESYDEIVFTEKVYHVARRGLSPGRLEEIAPWSFTEEQFDELTKQTEAVERIGAQPLGAPIVFSVPEPPKSLKSQAVNNGYNTATRLQGAIQRFFSRVASRHLLSHTILVEFVACQDWITRVTLRNQQDRSTRRVVGCLEPLGLFKLGGVGDDTSTQTVLYLLAGSLGQALALQDNLLQLARLHIEADTQLTTEDRRDLLFIINRWPEMLFYLYGYKVVEELDARFQVDGSIRLFARLVEGSISAQVDRGEHETLRRDESFRYGAVVCVKDFLFGINENKFAQLTYESIKGIKGAKQDNERISVFFRASRLIDYDKKTDTFSVSQSCVNFGKILKALSQS